MLLPLINAQSAWICDVLSLGSSSPVRFPSQPLVEIKKLFFAPLFTLFLLVFSEINMFNLFNGLIFNLSSFFSLSQFFYNNNSGVLRPIRVTVIGDSITEGGSCSSTESYVDLLRGILGTRYEVLNAGKSGMTMLKTGVHIDGDEVRPNSYWDTETWQTALNSDPDVVTIMLGTNDAKSYNWEGIQQNTGDYYALDYVDMIQQLSQLKSHPKIYILVPPPIFAPYPMELNSTVVSQIYPVLIRDIAAVMNVKVSFYSIYRSTIFFRCLYVLCVLLGCSTLFICFSMISETNFKIFPASR